MPDTSETVSYTHLDVYKRQAPWIPKRFSGKLVQEGQRKFMGTLWNTYAHLDVYKRQRQAAHRTCGDPYDQRYDSEIPDHERKIRSA